MGKTFAEKVLSKSSGRDVVAGDVVVVEPDFCMSHENAAAVLKTFEKIGVQNVFNRDKLVIIFDHTVPASTEVYANNQKVIRKFVEKQEIKHFYDMNNQGGICHQIMCQEGFSAPGLITVGTDSHTCTHGAMGAFSTGIGRSEMAAIWATGNIWFRVPETIKITVNGSFKPHVTAKDLILTIIGDIKADGADYMSVEFEGSGIENMSIAERMTLCNMGIEMGAKNAVCKPDEKVFAILKEKTKNPNWEVIWSDEDARYAKELVYNLEDIVPSVALPHTVDNYSTVREVLGTKIDQAFIGTCTNGRIEDLRAAASILKGKKVSIRTIINPASTYVYSQALEEGVIKDLLDSGCVISHPGCGPCVGVYGGVLAEDEVCISTANRNFKGRMGSRSSKIILASPETVAYSAIYGEIRNPFLDKEIERSAS